MINNKKTELQEFLETVIDKKALNKDKGIGEITNHILELIALSIDPIYNEEIDLSPRMIIRNSIVLTIFIGICIFIPVLIVLI